MERKRNKMNERNGKKERRGKNKERKKMEKMKQMKGLFIDKDQLERGVWEVFQGI